MKKVICGCALALMMTSVASAGQKLVSPVSVYRAADYSGGMSGSFGATRNSADTTSYLSCATHRYASGSPYMSCSARSASGVTGYCHSYSTQLITALESASGDSYIQVSWDTSGTCTEVFVFNDSRDEPKQ